MSEKSSPDDTNYAALPLLRRLFTEHGRPHIRSYIVAGLLMGIGAATTALSAWLLKPILNHMVDADGFKTLRLLAWGVVGLFALRGLVTWGYQVMLARTGNRIVAGVQRRLYEHLLRQDMSFFQDRHSTEFMTRLSIAAGGVRDTLQTLITSAGRDILTLVGLIIVMIIQDPIMALIALSIMPVGGFLLSKLIRRVRKSARRSYDGSARILETMQETVQGIRIVKSFNLEGIMRGRMSSAVREVEKSVNRMASGQAVSSPISDTVAGIAIGAVIFYGSWRVTIAGADPGSFFSFVAALLMAYEPGKKLARMHLDLQSGLTGARMIYEVLDTPAREEQREGLPQLNVGEGRIAFENISFGYRPGEFVLDGINLVAEPNATTALVGPSGGGKSTIIALIQRFYSPASGRIVIDGQNISDVDLVSLRNRIAFVSQDVFLFRGTIRENIALGKPDATEAEIEQAARMANAHDFIMGFKTGYETSVGEQGAQLSGGQRQRIAIARAFLKNAPIILLDEPTAALDSESEREVQKALDSLRQGRTTLVVAHRLQTIVNSDRICVIENGKAVETGTHEQLIAARGTYHAFFATQFGEGATPLRTAANPR
jgi:ATP-binding cassette subfamily B protein